MSLTDWATKTLGGVAARLQTGLTLEHITGLALFASAITAAVRVVAMFKS